MIYLDNSATTKICEEALEVYCEVSRMTYGNPSSLHALGFEAERVLDSARKTVLDSLYTKSGDIIFTASGSEANNLAIVGHALSKERYRGAKIVTTMGEHASVREPFMMLERMGYRVAYVPTVGGKVDLEALRREITKDTILLSVMMVNNETGAVYNIPEIAAIAKKLSPDIYIHVDATQSYMKIPFSPEALMADMVTVSSHKIEGPKGVGALYISKRVVKERGLAPIIHGGGQEEGLRSGTENVPGIAAFARAVEIAHGAIRERAARLTELREYLIDKIEKSEALRELSLTKPEMAAPHILNITLPRIKSETMLHYLSAEGIYVSSGSACSSNSHHVSSALTAYGRSEAEADSSIRVSLSHKTTREELDIFVSALEAGVGRLSRIR